MTKMHHGRVRRVTAEFRGDEAVELDILEATLRLGEVARTRMEADAMLVRIAFEALDRTIAEYCEKTGTRYPSYKALQQYLEEEFDMPAVESKVVNLPK